MPDSPGFRPLTPPSPPPPVPPRPPAVSGALAPRPAEETKKASALPQTPVVPVPEVSTVAIRTMQDDMEVALNAGTPPVPAPPAGGVSVPAKPAAATATTAPVFPLPPRQQPVPQKVVMAPVAARRSPGRARWVISGLVLLVVLAGAGAAGFWWWYNQGGTLFQPEPPAAAAAVLPESALLVVQYRLRQASDRADILAAWSALGDENEASLPGALAGDPRLFLDDSELNEFYYVLLEGEVRPYLVVPQTRMARERLGANSGAQVTEQSGWYVVHSLNTEPYTRELVAGSFAAGERGAAIAAESPAGGVRFFIGQGLVPRLRQDAASDDFLAGQLQSLTLGGSFLGSGGGLRVSGVGQRLGRLGEGTANQELLALVPPQVELVRLGAQFAPDVSEWLAMAGVVDENALSAPLPRQLFEQLTGPYAYWRHVAADTGASSLGLVIELPPAISGKLALGDPGLEKALEALVPLILDRRTVAPLSFTEVTYAGLPLRYANIVGTTQALDYALTPTHLLIATSKAGMQALLDTVTSGSSLATSSTEAAAFLKAWGTIPAARDVVIGRLQLPSLRQFLPGAKEQPGLLFGITARADAAGGDSVIEGIVEFGGREGESNP